MNMDLWNLGEYIHDGEGSQATLLRYEAGAAPPAYCRG